jgi:hypothetical protein
MAPRAIENQLGAGHIVLRHAPGRTVVFVAVVLIWARSLVWHPAGWLDVFGGVIAAFLAYTGIVVALQAVRGIPPLETSETGIAINSPWGAMFLHWRDTAEFSPGNYRWLRIRLREGARPVASTWMRIACRSWWRRRTILVPAFTTVARPAEIAEALSSLRATHSAT